MPEPTTLSLAVAIAIAVLQHGPSAVIAIAELFKSGEPTVEDISKLFITKKPEEYFKNA